MTNDSAVVMGRIGDVTVSTLTTYLDSPAGLPLDAVYKPELDKLREAGHVMVEVGLFADRRQHLFRSVEAILELMRYGTYFGVNVEATDAIIGVHPHHAAFYTRLLGFDMIGEEKPYDAVEGNAVVLLHLNWATKTSQPKLPRGLKHFVRNPLGQSTYAPRFRITPETIAGSPIEQYLRDATKPVTSVS